MSNQSITKENLEQWRYWIALRLVRGVGNVTYREMLTHFGSPQAVLSASFGTLTSAGVHAEVARAITSFDQWQAADAEVRNIAKAGVRLVTRSDAEYPENLTHLHDPPPFLYVRGSLLPEDRLAIAMVGSRSASAYGRGVARDLARGLAEKGITVVSGLARGIDAEAHRATLEAKGRTLAVLGSGLDVIYPGEHRSLAMDIAAQGAVLSEFALGSKPDAVHFPYRNRVISGLTLGTVVVEAAENSGSLITARFALEQNREVFAVPGAITAGRSKGPHKLIKEGAKLVENVEDILQEIAPALMPTPAAGAAAPLQLSLHESLLIGLFEQEPVHIDILIARSGLTPARVLEVLLELELKGLVTQLPGAYFNLAGEARGSTRK
ncbi:MAG TPA: DNA-processing protein DprA [Methylomirabilota bacterium]|jgi:DNA processing protein|nr:DNA-processing protein DprA [Methylomirabilota bacterium]